MSSPNFPIFRSRFWLRIDAMVVVRLLIIGGVLIASAVLVRFPAYGKLLLLLPIGLVAAMHGLNRPQLGLLALIPACLMVPFEIGTGSNTRIHAGMILLALLIGLWILEMLVHQRKIELVSSLPIRPLLIFVLVACLSYLVGQLSWFPLVSPAPQRAQLGGLGIFILSAGAFLLVAHQVRSVLLLRRLTWLFLALGSLLVLGQMMPQLWRLNYLFPRGAALSMFWLWMTALAASQAFINRDLRPVWRLVLIAVVVACLYVTVVQKNDWKSGWIPALAAVVTILGVYSWRSLLAIGVGSILPATYLFSRVVASDTYSYSTRLDAWEILGKIIQVSPVLGLGPANYYWYTPLFPIRGYAVQFNSHNQYVDMVAQTGLLGLFFFFAFALSLVWLGWQMRRQMDDAFSRAYVFGALGGLAGTLVAGMLGDWFLPFVYNVGFSGTRSSFLPWLFLGGLVALEQIRKQSLKPVPATNSGNAEDPVFLGELEK